MTAELESDYWTSDKQPHFIAPKSIDNVFFHVDLLYHLFRADEAARAVQMYQSEGLTPPAGAGGSRTRLDALLRCVERLYARDPLGLRNDYWQACQTHPHPHTHRSVMGSYIFC